MESVFICTIPTLQPEKVEFLLFQLFFCIFLRSDIDHFLIISSFINFRAIFSQMKKFSSKCNPWIRQQWKRESVLRLHYFL